MSISFTSLQKLISLNLSTEQMAGVIEVLAAELAPLEERKTKDRERKALLTSEWASIRALVLSLYDPVCSYCGSTNPSSVDHVIPVAAGGKSDIENLVPACGKCNSSKRDRPLKEWLACR